MQKLFILLTGLFFLGATSIEINWENLEQGLDYASIKSPQLSDIADSKIDVLRINPEYFEFDLVCAGDKKTENLKMDDWAKKYNLIAGVNANMYRIDEQQKTSMGYLVHKSYVNNPNLNPSYKSVFAFGPKKDGVPKAKMIDLSCENWDQCKSSYSSFSQGLRMLNCDGKNTWQLQEKKWSMVLLGQDDKGNILFIFVRSPYRVHDFVNILKGLPLGLKKLQYLEGGPEASFYLDHPKKQVKKFGSYETGFVESDDNDHYWEIPNVIGIRRK